MKKLVSVMLTLVVIVSMGSIAFGAPTITSKRTEAREVFDLINEEREAAGKDALIWAEELYEPAVTRAGELYTEFSHKRPDGTQWNSVSKLAHGENISWNRKTPKEVVSQWMNSQGHKDNIMGKDYDYKGVAAACVETDKGPYWVLLFTLTDVKPTPVNDKPTTALPATDKPVITTATGSPVVTTGTGAVTTTLPMEEPGAKSEYSGTALVTKLTELAKTEKGILTPSEKSGKTLSPAAIKELNDWITKNNREVAISFDTYLENGKTVEGRFNFYPKNFTKQTTDVSFGVKVTGDAVQKTLTKFSKWFANEIVVVELDHDGKLEGVADLAVKVDLSKLDTKTLKFYTYDAATNKYELQKSTKYNIDKNGYLHFTTKGKTVIITDKDLKRA